MVTADGTVRMASATSEPELFWALRGGGGNFGVVTSFEFQLHPVGPEVYAGLVVYPFAQARQVLRAWRDFNAGAPDELSVWAVLRKAPPLPFLPASAHGTRGRDLSARLLPATSRRASRPPRRCGIRRPDREPRWGRRPTPGSSPPSIRCSRRAAATTGSRTTSARLSDAALDLVIAAAARLPGPECEIFVAQLGGAMARVKPGRHGLRRPRCALHHERARPLVRRGRRRAGARLGAPGFQEAAPHATGSGYVNFLTEDEAERVAASYGANYPRLQAVKRRFDPDNLFRMNLNIAPAARRDEGASP